MIRDLALLGARLAVGGGMAAHGTQKAFGWFEGPGPEQAAKMMHGLGFRPGETYATLAAWNEIVAGKLIAWGLGGPVGPAMLISGMIVAQASVHWEKGFFAQKGGIELPLVYSAAALALAAGDYGALSLDAALGLRKPLRDPVFTALTLAGAVAGAIVGLNGRDHSAEGPATPTFRGKNSPLPEPEKTAS
ncbi:MAG: DoxX family protein [Candidatus Lustribacter sp.]